MLCSEAKLVSCWACKRSVCCRASGSVDVFGDSPGHGRVVDAITSFMFECELMGFGFFGVFFVAWHTRRSHTASLDL
jgi:hypothetical protein